MPTTAHPAASRIPKPSRVPAVVADPDDLADLVWADGYRPNGIDTALRAKDNGMVCVPASNWRPQLERAMVELRAEAVEKGQDPAKVFLTENDIITAFILRCFVAAGSMHPDKLVCVASSGAVSGQDMTYWCPERVHKGRNPC